MTKARLEGHKLGVISVAIDSTGKCMLDYFVALLHWCSLTKSTMHPRPLMQKIVSFNFSSSRVIAFIDVSGCSRSVEFIGSQHYCVGPGAEQGPEDD